MKPVLLIVDDEVRVLSALRRSLRREGYEILLASTPAEAMKLLAEREIDAVLSDHKMPGMSGIELLRATAEQRPHAARLLISGWPEAVSPEDLRSIAPTVVLPKPWRDAELKAELRAALHPS